MIGESGTCACGQERRLVKLYTKEHVFREEKWDCMNGSCAMSIMHNVYGGYPDHDDDFEDNLQDMLKNWSEEQDHHFDQ